MSFGRCETYSTAPPPTYYPPQSCGNNGLDFAVQSHEFTNQGVEFPDLQIDYFHTAPVLQTGTTAYTGITNEYPETPYSIYGGAPIKTPFTAVNHRGYFVPDTPGFHTFEVSQADDVVVLWLGEDALDGNYNGDNQQFAVGVGEGAGTYTTPFLFPGHYYPIRFLCVNGQGPVDCQFTMYGPAGNVIIGADTTTTGSYFVQYSCDGSYPPFDAFGQESETTV